MVGMPGKKHLIKTVQNCLLHLKYVGNLWEIWRDRLSHQHSTCMYIFMNHWIATNTTGVIVSQSVKRVVSYIIFTLRAQNVRLHRVARSQMSTNWDDASRTSEQSESCCSLNMRLATSVCLRSYCSFSLCKQVKIIFHSVYNHNVVILICSAAQCKEWWLRAVECCWWVVN